MQPADSDSLSSASDWIMSTCTADKSTQNPALLEFRDDGDTFPLAAGGSASTSAGSSSPVASIATLATWLVNGFWQNQSALPHHWASNTITYNLGNLNSAEQALALSALNAWHEVANINFVQTSGAANITFNHDGTMQAFTSASWNGSGLMTSATVDISSDWVTTDGGANDGKTGIDSYAYQTYVHEIGHALGLGHQGPYNGSASYSTNAIFANDTWQYSIMSYFAEPNYSGSSYRYAITPQMADMYAVGTIYGAATSTRSGDNVYGFNATAGPIYNFSSYTQAPALTIYDSSGNDTLDCSGYFNNQNIDLRTGNFSSVGGLVNNVGIALNTVIENAIGGSGNDTLIANNSGCTLNGGGGTDTLNGGTGNDRLIGGAARDIMTGNGGTDTFVFASGDTSAAIGQHDMITDFSPGDIIDLSALGAFHFLGTAAFDQTAGALNYVYNSSTGITGLQGDINGDGIADFAIDLSGQLSLTALSNNIVSVQPPLPTVIESFGVTGLVQIGSSFAFYPVAGGTGPQLKYDGSAVTAGQFGTWTPIGAEQTATGYDMAWKDPSDGNYTVWSTDGSGNFVSIIVPAGLGSSTSFQSIETVFLQDLNGDGRVGLPPPPPPSAIESFGVTSLVQIGSNFAFYPVAGGTGPQLKYDGSAVTGGQFGTWTPVGAEHTATGYDVAWKNPSNGNYTVWSTDSSGNFMSIIVAAGPGSSSALQSIEPVFHQDLNGDGSIGLPSPPAGTTIEALGSTSLFQSGNNFYFNPVAGGTGPQLRYVGSAVSAGQFGTWTPIGAEQTATGYDVAWKDTSNGNYTVWSTDSSGNFASIIVPAGPGSSSALQAIEPVFHQDLNGDGFIGVSTNMATIRPSNGVAPNLHADRLAGAVPVASSEVPGIHRIWDSTGDIQSGHLMGGLAPNHAHQDISGTLDAAGAAIENGSRLDGLWAGAFDGNQLSPGHNFHLAGIGAGTLLW